MVSNTSKQAYAKLVNVGGKRYEVFMVIGEHPNGIDNLSIAKVLGWEINRVTGRTNELVSGGVVELAGVATNINNQRSKLWRLSLSGEKVFERFKTIPRRKLVEVTPTVKPIDPWRNS